MKNSFVVPDDLYLNGNEREIPSNAQPDLIIPPDVVENLPVLVRQFLKYGSPLSDAPDEFHITPFLAICGALIGNRRFINVGAITLYPVIWTVIFATSTTFRKSTSLSIAESMFTKLINYWKNKYNNDLAEWELKKQQAKDTNETQKISNESRPIKRTLYGPDGFSDLTFWEVLRDNESIVSIATEFAGLWNELNRPRNSLTEFALQIFDCKVNNRRNTRMGGDIEIENPVWCIAGATTVKNFQRSLKQNERDSGLLQRILPVIMTQRTKEFMALTELPKPDATLYLEITDRLFQLSDLETREVEIESDAKTFFTKWSHEINTRSLELEKQIDDIGSYISRLTPYALKFAMIFETLDNENRNISLTNMKASIALCEWLLKHQIYMLERKYIFNQSFADRQKILEIISRREGLISRTDLMNLSNMDRTQLDRALENEIDAGNIDVIKNETGGRPRYEYSLRKDRHV